MKLEMKSVKYTGNEQSTRTMIKNYMYILYGSECVRCIQVKFHAFGTYPVYPNFFVGLEETDGHNT